MRKIKRKRKNVAIYVKKKYVKKCYLVKKKKFNFFKKFCTI